MMHIDFTQLDAFWNWVNILVLIVAAAFNIGYYLTHVNGKKYMRLWIGITLIIAMAMRLSLAFGFLDEFAFIDVFRPFAALLVLGFVFGPYIDWGLPKKSLKKGG